MKNKILNVIKNSPDTIIILFQMIVSLICCIIFYPFIPLLLNYPPNSINSDFQLAVNVSYYIVYYIITTVIVVIAQLFIVWLLLRPLRFLGTNDKIKIMRIRQTCFSFPSQVLIYFTLIPVVTVIVVLTLMSVIPILTIKIALLIFIFLALPNTLTYMISTRITKIVLAQTSKFNVLFGDNDKKRTSIVQSIIMQITPTVLVCIVFLFMLALSLTSTKIRQFKVGNQFRKAISI